MKKSILFWGVAVMMVLLLSIIIVISFAGNKSSYSGDLDANLYVDGAQTPYAIVFQEDQRYVELPILAVVKALGYSVREIEDNTFEAEVGEKIFLIDTANGMVIDKDDPRHEDMIITTPGATFFYKEARDGDIYVDQESMRTLFMFMGIRATIRVDYKVEQVFISPRRA